MKDMENILMFKEDIIPSIYIAWLPEVLRT